jgi:hypothetical protein
LENKLGKKRFNSRLFHRKARVSGRLKSGVQELHLVPSRKVGGCRPAFENVGGENAKHLVDLLAPTTSGTVGKESKRSKAAIVLLRRLSLQGKRRVGQNFLRLKARLYAVPMVDKMKSNEGMANKRR